MFVEISLKLLVSEVPSWFSAAIIATAMRAAMRPYSIAVTPFSSRRKLTRFIVISKNSMLAVCKRPKSLRLRMLLQAFCKCNRGISLHSSIHKNTG